MFFEIAEISDPLHFCVGVVLKEAKEEYLLIGQLLCVMLSAYTNNPLNIAVNSPPGEGKSYVIHKVAEKFPKEDVIFLAGMTDKALFHRSGVLVVKNENGEYEYVEDKLDSIEFQIEDKESEIARSRDSTLQKTLKHQIKQLEKEKGDLLKIARKLIDLDHKNLIFTDTPRTELLSALLPLLSHDKHKVEHEYVDTMTASGLEIIS
jgi:hypothetical protein